MSLTIRPATPDDAPQMCALLNAIIEKGGTTAHRVPYDTDRMISDYVASAYAVSCFVADEDGEVLGFQSLEQKKPTFPLPEGWGLIATFVKMGVHGKGVGAQLFEATRKAARDANLTAIDATIRLENIGGLAFYTKMGFVDYATKPEVVSKKYDLSTED
ncbi:GNAT family N-acetyltransferase [Cognatishimia sp. MH4019]|uniref:GNAT family N-acetyltransferase n=1 Tax=Cognatishimia sp. MH4019 TaxID=2854030 RepID=UPI001CD34BFC|nr:GNAT family N-acetyltransferase [Cognatishimia sp. MH4019]